MGSVSDNGSRSCRIREEGLVPRRGHIGFVLVGVDLVVAKILSGPRHRVGLGIRGKGLGVREEVLGESVSTTLASGFSGIRSGKKDLSHLCPSVEEFGMPGFGLRVRVDALCVPCGRSWYSGFGCRRCTWFGVDASSGLGGVRFGLRIS